MSIIFEDTLSVTQLLAIFPIIVWCPMILRSAPTAIRPLVAGIKWNCIMRKNTHSACTNAVIAFIEQFHNHTLNYIRWGQNKDYFFFRLIFLDDFGFYSPIAKDFNNLIEVIIKYNRNNIKNNSK